MPILNCAIQITLCCYGLAMVLCLARLYLGPSTQDRILAGDFVYNVGMLSVLVLSIYYKSTTYFEIALLIAIFGFVSSLSIAKFLVRGEVIE